MRTPLRTQEASGQQDSEERNRSFHQTAASKEPSQQKRASGLLKFKSAFIQPPDNLAPSGCDHPHSLLTPTVFHEEWWLDSATGGSFSIAEVVSSGKVVGRLPFVVRNRFGIRGVWTPPLTHFLGPAIDDGNGSANSRFLRRLEITRELIAKLPKSSWQCIRCHRGTTDVIAFQEESFKTYAHFTHEIHPGPADVIWQQMRDKTRNVIRRAQEQFEAIEMNDPEEFARAYERHLSSRQMRNTLDLQAAQRLVRAALERGRGRVLAVRNEKGDIAAANFCAWDDKTSFYIACTRDGTAGNGANSLLLWEAIQHAVKNGLMFDFAGLGTRGSILHYAGFGAAVATRFVAVRASLLGKVIARARAMFGEEHFLY